MYVDALDIVLTLTVNNLSRLCIKYKVVELKFTRIAISLIIPSVSPPHMHMTHVIYIPWICCYSSEFIVKRSLCHPQIDSLPVKSI